MSEAASAHGIHSRVQAARDEKVMVIPNGAGFTVVPPYKVVSPGQTVTFRAFNCDSLEIEGLDPQAFGPPNRLGPKSVTVMVKDGANGVFDYRAVVEVKGRRKRAKGNSPPGIIVDGG